MTVKELENLGFIYKRISKHWYLVKLYANKKYTLIFPMRLK